MSFLKYLMLGVLVSPSVFASQLYCEVSENSKPFYGFLVDMEKDGSVTRRDCRADLVVEQSESYIGKVLKSSVVASKRQTTRCFVSESQIGINWVDGDIATLNVEKRTDGTYEGTIDFPYGASDVGISEEAEFTVRCSMGNLSY